MKSRPLLFLPVVAAGLGLAQAPFNPPIGGNIAHAQTTVSAPANISAPATSSTPSPSLSAVALLAECVPGDVMLYLEVQGLDAVLGSKAGAGIAAEFIRTIKGGSASAPASAAAGAMPAASNEGLNLRQIFATAVSLQNTEAIRLLFSGPLAVAADGWSGLGDAIMIVRPAHPTALEAVLTAQRVAASMGKVRRYALGGGHELACNGRTVVVGRTGKRTGLLARTVEQLDRGGTGSLGEQPEFRERMSALPATSQLALYVGRAGSGGLAGPDPLTAWWPDDWPRLKTVALGVVLGGDGATIKVSGSLDAEGPQLKRSEPPIQMIRRLPMSALGAWTQAIDYVGGFRRLRSRYAQEFDGFRFDAIEAGLEPGTLDKRLLGHLVGDTIVVIDTIAIQPREATDAQERLTLPMAALMVETDDPDAVAGALGPVTSNLSRMLNPPSPADQPMAIRTEPVGPGGPAMYIVPLGRALSSKNHCDLLQTIDLCVTVADRWLIVGTHPQAVRRLVESRREAGPTLSIGDLDRVVEQVAARGGQPRRVLFAVPHGFGAMIQTWVQHLARYHPEMLQGQWWDKVLRRQRAMGKQMGILARAVGGTVEIVDTLPGGPRDRLQAADRILAVDGIKIDPANPLKSLREYVAERAQADRVVLLVRRGNDTKEITLLLPNEPMQGSLRSPVDLLKRFADVASLFDSASYVLWQPRPDVVDARIDLRYARPAATRPATSQATRK